MIYIDFQGGSHGNFLEFACNTLLAKIPYTNFPFNNFGASHVKTYQTTPKFKSGHYFQKLKKLHNSQIISIQITANDLLPLSSISLLRAGDYHYDNNELEINTYHKLNNENYKWVLKNIIDSFSLNQVRDSYNAVRDSSWPVIDSLNDFKNLPKHIKQECTEIHNLHLVEITADTPDCPRWVLREFFKLSFKYPEHSGFMTQQHNTVYDNSNDVYYFPFGSFYNLEWFNHELIAISNWANLSHTDPTELHSKFMEKQLYYNDKNICDAILTRIYNEESFNLQHLDLMKESYLAAQLELHYNREFPIYQPEWFKHSQEILEFIKK